MIPIPCYAGIAAVYNAMQYTMLCSIQCYTVYNTMWFTMLCSIQCYTMFNTFVIVPASQAQVVEKTLLQIVDCSFCT